MTTAVLLLLCAQLGGDTLGAVRFQGNRTFPGKVLLGVVQARKGKSCNEALLARDIAALERFYQDQGFFDAQVDRSLGRGRRPALMFSVSEGSRTTVGAIALSGNRHHNSEQLLGRLPAGPGHVATRAALDGGTQTLRAFYLNAGFPLVAVSGTMSRQDSLATLSFDITEGPLCHVAELRVRGNRGVSTSVILRAAEVRLGERFSQARLYQAQTRLYATRLFSRVAFVVEPPDMSGGQESIPAGRSRGIVVRFDVSEQPYRFVAFGGGFETPPNRALVSAEWEHNNLFGRGHTAQASTEVGPAFNGDFRAHADATYRMPYFLLTRIDLQFRPYFSYERIVAATTREFGEEIGMTRSLTTQLTLGLTNRLRFVSDTTTGVTNSLGLSGQYDSRDDVFDPRHGLSAQAAAEVAGGILQGRNDFYRLTGDVRVYMNIGFGFVLAARGMAGQAVPFGTRTRVIPYYEGFTLGGRNSLRGYPERSLGPDSSSQIQGRYGPAVTNANLELRTPYLFRLVGLVGFADLGAVSLDFSDMACAYTAGAGVRVRTPIGPVRLDWGKRLSDPQPQNRGRFYLGLLHAF